jgi:hypothetical protein
MSNDKFGPMEFVGKRPLGWHLKIILDKKIIEDKAFSYDDFGGRIPALKAAQSHRNFMLNERGMVLRVRAKRGNADKEMLTGVSETATKRKSKIGEIHISRHIASLHPTGALRLKRFYYSECPTAKNQKSRGEAIALANQQRIDWEAEQGLRPLP